MGVALGSSRVGTSIRARRGEGGSATNTGCIGGGGGSWSGSGCMDTKRTGKRGRTPTRAAPRTKQSTARTTKEHGRHQEALGTGINRERRRVLVQSFSQAGQPRPTLGRTCGRRGARGPSRRRRTLSSAPRGSPAPSKAAGCSSWQDRGRALGQELGLLGGRRRRVRKAQRRPAQAKRLARRSCADRSTKQGRRPRASQQQQWRVLGQVLVRVLGQGQAGRHRPRAAEERRPPTAPTPPERRASTLATKESKDSDWARLRRSQQDAAEPREGKRSRSTGSRFCSSQRRCRRRSRRRLCGRCSHPATTSGASVHYQQVRR